MEYCIVCGANAFLICTTCVVILYEAHNISNEIKEGNNRIVSLDHKLTSEQIAKITENLTVKSKIINNTVE